eukprot:1938188-Pyramimonas_sp.AAC.1
MANMMHIRRKHGTRTVIAVQIRYKYGEIIQSKAFIHHIGQPCPKGSSRPAWGHPLTTHRAQARDMYSLPHSHTLTPMLSNLLSPHAPIIEIRVG